MLLLFLPHIPISPQKDSAAWIIQTWAAFVLSVSMTTFEIVNYP
jgi:hypothetical protein